MQAEELIKHIENWAPPGVAWNEDNVGIQVGSGKSKISNIFLTLELDEKSLRQAIKNKCNFIFTHHPFIFRPLKKIETSNDTKSKLIAELIKNDITLYSAHTNLDFTRGGVSFELARILGLKNISFLENSSDDQYKLVVFVPSESVEKVAESIFASGAGEIGDYSKCSYKLEGNGTFWGNTLSNPSVGKKGKLETVPEIRLEILVPKWNLNKAISALVKTHPYEEPAYDVYPVKNKNSNYGFGAIGDLEIPMNTKNFLAHVCKSLKTNNLRYCSGKNNLIKRIAVCGGSGTELLFNAIGKNADAFVTADIKYHPFQDAENKILFIDAGHYETEIHSLNAVKQKIKKIIAESGDSINIFKYTGSTNPVKFFNK